MNKLIAASILTLAVAYPALAESPTAWPRYPHQGIEAQAPYRGPVKAAPAAVPSWTADSQSYANWRLLPAANDAGGQFPTSAKDLDAQQREFRKYWQARHRELTASGEWADVLPVRIHERVNAKAFGSPVMGGDN